MLYQLSYFRRKELYIIYFKRFGKLFNSHNKILSFLGECGTEEIYHAAATGNFDLGIMITGSHNPADENGFKLVRRGAIPIGHDSGLRLLGEKTTQILEDAVVRHESIISRNLSCAKSDRAQNGTPLRQKYLDWLVKYRGSNDPRRTEIFGN